MTFELTPKEDRTPEELEAALKRAEAKAKSEEEKRQTQTGCLVLIGLLIVVGLVLNTCLSRKPEQETPNSPDTSTVEGRPRSEEAPSDVSVISGAQQAVKRQLVDDRSARFKNVYVVAQSSGAKAVCGEVNSKNRAGGYAGYQHFISAGTESTTYLEEQVPDFAEAWNQLCVK